MKIIFYTLACTFLLSACKKDIDINKDINLVGQPLSVFKAYTKGKFKIKYILLGFTGTRMPVDSQYVFITNDSLIFTTPRDIFRSKLTWKKATNMANKETYAMVTQTFGTLFPSTMQDGVLGLGYNGYDAGGYMWERQK